MTREPAAAPMHGEYDVDCLADEQRRTESASAAIAPESFLIRTVGGPHPGSRVATSDVLPWPLPDTLPDPEGRGRYVKGTESQLPPQTPESHVMRGAEYFWEGHEDGAVLCAVIGCSNVATHTDGGHPTCDECMRPMWKENRG